MTAVRPFSLLVKPAGPDCNLRCSYCFYLGKCALYPDQKRHRMTDTVLEAMIRSYMATEQPQYAFGWQGGEPTLMGLDFFVRATELQQRDGRDGAAVSNGLQTNGTLIDDAFARHLGQYKFLVGVSVDGPEAVHDQSRLTVDGRGSHADVMRGIECLKRHDVEFNILTLVSRANVKHARDVYRYLRDAGHLFHQYIECVEYDSDGRLQPYAVSGPEWGEFMCTIYNAWIKHDTRRVSVRLFDSILAKLVDGEGNVCKFCRDCRQYFVVEHNGDVYPCDFFVEEDLKLGNVVDGDWAAFRDSPVYEAFGKRKANWCDACDACPWVEICLGDCPKNRRGAEADGKALSELCAGWRMFYAHTMDGFKRLAGEIRQERAASVRPGRTPPVNPNAPCPCGSGRPFKDCHGA